MTPEQSHDLVAEVAGVGEVMGLLDPDCAGPLEDAKHFTLRVSGAEANVLIALSRLGHRTTLVSAVGDDPLGRLILSTLAEQRVDVAHVQTHKAAPTGLFFKERINDGLRRVYYYREGSAASLLTPVCANLDAVGTPSVLIVSGLSLGLGRPNGLAAVARSAIERFAAAGTTVVFDPNIRPRLWDGERAVDDFAAIRDKVDILIAGRQEVSTLMPDLSADEAAHSLCHDGMRGVVIKDGARGAVVFEGTSRSEVPPFPVGAVVDPVGAGDAFAAGVVSGLLRGWPLLDGARLGAVLGARAVTVSGDWEAVWANEDPERLLQSYMTATTRSKASDS